MIVMPEHIPFLAESEDIDDFKVYAYCSCGWESPSYWDSRAEAALDYVDNHPGFPKYPDLKEAER